MITKNVEAKTTIGRTILVEIFGIEGLGFDELEGEVVGVDTLKTTIY